MFKWWHLLLGCLILSCASFCFAEGKAILLDINGAIGPATVDYVKRSISYADKEQARVFIIRLNTPGGLESSMRAINESIITSPIPIITYVAPAGARAASAGTFILYASHIAAMAPGTNLGAATPVSALGSDKEEKKETSAGERKAVNDASAYIRSLAQMRHRNVNWGESAVRSGVSLSATEAKRANVIDLIADSDESLLKQINGKEVNVNGAPQKLTTNDLKIETIQADWRYQFLAFITNPNIAYILLLIAMYGLFFEFSNPGMVLPGVAGIIALFLVLYAFQLMPINYAGLTLLLVGIVFMLFELYVSSFGVIGIGGVIAFLLGSVMLFDVNDANYRLAWTLISIMSIFTVSFFFIVLSLALSSHKKAIITGKEGLIGTEGVVINILDGQSMVRVLGEIWDAKSSKELHHGERIRVTDVQGLTLIVEPLPERRIK